MKSILLAVWSYLVSFYENGSLPRIEKLANSPLGQVFSQGWLGRLRSTLQKLFEINLRQLYSDWLEEHVDNIKSIIAFWQRGWMGRLELLTLAAGGLLVPSVVVLNMENADGTISTPLLVAGLILYALAYAFACTAAGYLSFPLYTLTSMYLIWYAFIIGGSLKGTFLFALPSLWLLFSSWLLVRPVEGRSKYFWLGLLCLAVSYLTYGAFGIYARFKDVAAEWVMVLVLALVYYALLVLLLYWQRAQTHRRPPAALLFTGTLLVMAVFFILAGIKDKQLTADLTLLSVRGLLGWVDFFWMWLGAAAIESALDSGDWWTESSMKVIPRQAVRWFIPVLWLSSAVLGWVATLSSHSAGVSWFLYTSGLQNWIDTWDDGLYFMVQFQVYVSLVILVCWAAARLLRRDSDDLLALLSGVWVAVFLAGLGFYQSFQGFETLESDAILEADWWLALVLILGLVWELAQAGEDYWDADTPGRHFAVVAVLGYMFSISAMTLGAGLPDLVMEYTFFTFNGMVYLGAPLMLFILLKRLGHEPIGKKQLIGLLILGALSAVIPLSINPLGDWSLCLAPVVWFLILIIFGIYLNYFKNRLDAIVAGGALATGFITFWMSPEVIPIPFLGFIQEFQDRYLTIDLHRPVLQEGQAWFSLAALTAGMMSGWLVFMLWRYIFKKNPPAAAGE